MALQVDIASLRDLYVNQQKTIHETALALGVSHTLVWKQLVAEGIPRRSPRKAELEDIRRLFHDEGFPLQQVAETLGISKQAAHDRLRRAGISTRRTRSLPPEPDREMLYQLYVTRRLNVAKTAEFLGVSIHIVRRALKRYSIPCRSSGPKKHPGIERETIYKHYVEDGLTLRQVAKRLAVSQRIVARELVRHRIDHRHKRGRLAHNIDDDELRRLYVVEGLSLAAIGERFRVHGRTIANRLESYGIERRPRGGRSRNAY